MYSLDKNFTFLISKLMHDFSIRSERFYENYMEHNPDKCYFLTTVFYKPFPDFSFENTIIKNVIEEKILGIVIDNNLKLKSHMKNICAKPYLSPIARISKLTTPTQKKKLINCFINAEVTYCPLIWMFCSKRCYKLINKIEERLLSLILNDYESSFDSLLSTLNDSSTLHERFTNRSIQIFKWLLLRFNELSLLFTPKTLQLTQF